jgi:hypothetical protein
MYCCVACNPREILAGLTAILFNNGMRVTTAEADFVESACATAVTVTVAGVGMADGAVYRPNVEIVPTVAFPPATPFTCQVTAVFVAFVTVALNCWVSVVVTVGVVGVTVTATAGIVT